MNLVRQLALPVLLVLALLAAIWAQAQSRVDGVAYVEGAGRYQVFWDTGGGFSEASSIHIDVPGDGLRRIPLPDLPASVLALRIDPPVKQQEIRFCGVEATGPDARPVWPVNRVTGYAEVQARAVPGHCIELTVDAKAADPQFLVRPEYSGAPWRQRLAHWHWLTWLGVVVLAAFGVAIAPATVRQRMGSQIAAAGDWLDRRLVVCFLVVGGVFGSGYALLAPPGSVPDEAAHAGKIARMQAGDWFGHDRPGPFLPVLQWYGPFSDYMGERRYFTFAQLSQQASQPLACERTEPGVPGHASSGTPLAYMLASVVLTTTCAIDGSFSLFLYGSRLLNLLLSLALAAVGIRFAQTGRWTLFAVALLPMSLYLQASLSYDSLMLGATFGYLGILSGAWSGTLPCRRAIGWMGLFSLLLVTAKPLTGWLFWLPLLALPNCRRQGFPLWVWIGCLVLLPSLAHAGWVLASVGQAVARPGVAVHGVDGLLSDPVAFIHAGINTFSLLGGVLSKQLVGVLGWLDVTMSEWAYTAAWAVVFGSVALSPSIDQNRRAPALAYVVALTLAAVAAWLSVFYAFWTPVASPVIEGLQGRYFIALILPLLVFMRFPLRSAVRPAISLLGLGLLIAINLAGWKAVIARYYIL